VLRPGLEDRDADALIEAWMQENAASVARATAMLDDLREAETLDIAMLSVALREIRNLSETTAASATRPG
jgi:NAD-specific glutamate dehydrogenase